MYKVQKYTFAILIFLLQRRESLYIHIFTLMCSTKFCPCIEPEGKHELIHHFLQLASGGDWDDASFLVKLRCSESENSTLFWTSPHYYTAVQCLVTLVVVWRHCSQLENVCSFYYMWNWYLECKTESGRWCGPKVFYVISIHDRYICCSFLSHIFIILLLVCIITLLPVPNIAGQCMHTYWVKLMQQFVSRESFCSVRCTFGNHNYNVKEKFYTNFLCIKCSWRTFNFVYIFELKTSFFHV